MSKLIESVISASKHATEGNPKTSRAHAVAAALEVISAYASSENPKFSLSDQMKKLSGYADAIQEALKKE